jgi:hypothetical protein
MVATYYYLLDYQKRAAGDMPTLRLAAVLPAQEDLCFFAVVSERDRQVATSI